MRELRNLGGRYLQWVGEFGGKKILKQALESLGDLDLQVGSRKNAGWGLRGEEWDR